jgi:26S proteasome regulatory subunit N1
MAADKKEEAGKAEAKKGDAKKDAKKGKEPEPELTEEEMELKKNLELMVERISDVDPGLQVRDSAIWVVGSPSPHAGLG